jgi:hypothetical protein
LIEYTRDSRSLQIIFYEKNIKDCRLFLMVSWTPASAGVTIVTNGKEGLKLFVEKRKNVFNQGGLSAVRTK